MARIGRVRLKNAAPLNQSGVQDRLPCATIRDWLPLKMTSAVREGVAGAEASDAPVRRPWVPGCRRTSTPATRRLTFKGGGDDPIDMTVRSGKRVAGGPAMFSEHNTSKLGLASFGFFGGTPSSEIARRNGSSLASFGDLGIVGTHPSQGLCLRRAAHSFPRGAWERVNRLSDNRLRRLLPGISRRNASSLASFGETVRGRACDVFGTQHVKAWPGFVWFFRGYAVAENCAAQRFEVGFVW